MGRAVKKPDADLYGQATAYGNNCAFHCLAETLFRLPDDKLKIIAESPAFQNICESFKDRYGIKEPVNLKFIKEFNAKIQHPYDFQLIWGPVLRDAFYKEIPNLNDIDGSMSIYREKNGEWKYDQTIENDHLFKFVLALGADLDITADNEYDRFSGSTMREVFPDAYPPTTVSWKLELKFERPDRNVASGHYSFKLPDTAIDADRNEMLKPAPPERHQIFDEDGNIRELIDDKPGFLIPSDENSSALDVLSNKKYGERFHKITGELGEDGTALRADLLKDVVQATLIIKPIDPMTFEKKYEQLQEAAHTLMDDKSGKLKKEVAFKELEQMGVMQMELNPISRILSAIGAILLAMLEFFKLKNENKNNNTLKL